MWNWLDILPTSMEESEEGKSDVEIKIMENNKAEQKRENYGTQE